MSSSTKRIPKKLSTSTNKQTAKKSIRISTEKNGNQRTVAKPLICDRSPSLVRHRILAQKSKNEEVRKFREMIREVYHQTDGLSTFTQTSVLSIPPEVTSDRYLLGQYKYAKKNSSATTSEVSSQYSKESEKALELEPDQLINQIRNQVRSQIEESQPKNANKNNQKKPVKTHTQNQNNLQNQVQKQLDANKQENENEILIDGSNYIKEPVNLEEIQTQDQVTNNQNDSEDIAEEEEIEFEIERHEEEQNDSKFEDETENQEDPSNFVQSQPQALEMEEEEIEDDFEINTQEEISDDVEQQDQEKQSNTEPENNQEVSLSNDTNNSQSKGASNFIEDENNDNEKDINFNDLYNSNKEEAEFLNHTDNDENTDFNELYNAAQKESINITQPENDSTNFSDLYHSSQIKPTHLSKNFTKFNKDAPQNRTYNLDSNHGNEYEIEADVEVEVDTQEEEEEEQEDHTNSQELNEFRQQDFELHNKESVNQKGSPINGLEKLPIQKDFNLANEDGEFALNRKIDNYATPTNPRDQTDNNEGDDDDDSDRYYNPNERPLVSPRSYKSPFRPHKDLKAHFQFSPIDKDDPGLKFSGEQLLEISVRPFLYNLSIKYGEPIRRLREIPEFEFLDWKSMGFQWVWLYGVWNLGSYCLNFDLTDPDLISRYNGYLPGWTKEDVIGYPLSIVSYDVNPEIGDIDDLIWFREKLQSLHIRLMLDFVPNHTAIDASEVTDHPEYYIHSKSSTEKDEIDANRFIKEKGNIAYGAGINMPPMKFTAQLNIFTPQARKMQIDNLLKIAKLCDGVRVHLAHFLLTQQFQKYWKQELDDGGFKSPEAEFWIEAIDKVRFGYPEFVMMAESYGSENQEKLIECGFSYIYDKELIDHLVSHDVSGFRDLIFKNHFITDKMVHFVENHDEPRMITRFGGNQKEALTASVALLTLPGIRLINMQQWLGYQNQIDVNLRRAAPEKCNQEIVKFYTKLFNILESNAVLHGEWKPMPVLGPCSDKIVAWKWVKNKQHILVTINFNNCWSQGRIICDDLSNDSTKVFVLEMISETYYTRESISLREEGLKLSLEPYQAQVFEY